MGLFLDGPVCTIDDLVKEDSGLLSTAQTVGINVTAKILLAMGELQSEIENWLPPAYVVWIGPVVVTPELARWGRMLALSTVYRDAYYSQLVDRYQGKWTEYVKLTGDARQQFMARGVAMVDDPLFKPSVPLLGTNPAPGAAGGMFYASVAWVNEAGEEGAASDASSLHVEDGNLMTVSADAMPLNATGFNVYAGTVLACLQLQNVTPLSRAAMFTYVPGAVTGGRAPGPGQLPNYVAKVARKIWRG